MTVKKVCILINPFPLDPYPKEKPFSPPDSWDEEFYDEE